MHRKPTIAVLAAAVALAIVSTAQATRNPGVDDDAITARDRAVEIDVTANDGLGGGPLQSLSLSRKPANGTVAVSGSQLVYTPAPGFTGRDSFRYVAKRGRQLAQATVTVDVGDALVLSGKVTDGPIAGAQVVAQLDGRSFTTEADADGQYALEVISTDGGMVRLSAQGVGAQSIANFTSFVGDFPRLQAEAGADATLTRDENHQVQVTNVSTAQAMLVLEALAGVPVDDDAALSVGIESLDYARLLRSAAAIKLAVDGGFALPEGVEDTWALVSHLPTMEGFLTEVEAESPGATEAAAQAIASDPELMIPVEEDDLLGSFTLLYHLGAPGTIGVGYIQGERHTLEPGGTGRYSSQWANPNPATSWTLEDGQAVVVPVAPVPLQVYVFIPDVGQVRQLRTTVRMALSKLGEAGGRETFAVTWTTEMTYPDNPEIPDETATATATRVGIRDTQALPFNAATLAGTTWVLPIGGTGYGGSNGSGSERLSFASGGTGTRADGPAFSWTVDAGGLLQVSYGPGHVERYALVAEDGRGGAAVLLDSQTAAGAATWWSLVARDDGNSGYTAASAAQSWRSGFYVSRVNPDARPGDFFIVLDAGAPAPGFAVTDPGDGVHFGLRLGWAIDGQGRMVASYYRNGSNQPVHFCVVGVDGCRIVQQRRWRLVASDGDRQYVNEEFLYDYDNDGTLEVDNQRVNFYDIAPRPVFPATPPTAVRKLRKS